MAGDLPRTAGSEDAQFAASGGCTVGLSRVLLWAGRSIVPLGIAFFAVAFFVNIENLNADAVRYPNVIIPITLLLVALNLIAEVRGVAGRQGEAIRSPRAVIAEVVRGPLPLLRPVVIVGLAAFFAFSIPRAGFYPSAFGFLLAAPWALGLRGAKSIAVVGVSVSLSAYLLFEYTLGLSLPQRGW